MAGLLFVPLRSEAEISNQSTDSCYLEDVALFAHSGSCKLFASCSRNMGTAACNLAEGGGWVPVTVLRAEID